MVQRKAPNKIGSHHERGRNQQEDTRSKRVVAGDSELKKKLKLERSMRAAELESPRDSPTKPKKRCQPNYMKPTSCWDARKEQAQVTSHTKLTTTDKKRNTKNSKPSSSSAGLRLHKNLSRQSSLKAIRPLMQLKKGVVVNRPTCSSTLKESDFPKYLDLNPEGTSVLRVCPYTYCSLNGHRHEALPPLKCFMSARRKSLKTQRSLKLKGISSLRLPVLGKDKKEIDTGQRARTEEVPDDFFIEIYCSNPDEQTDDGQMKKDGLDENSEPSDDEVDVLMSFQEYVECDEQVEDGEKQRTQGLMLEDSGESLPLKCENEASILDCKWEEEAGSLNPETTTELYMKQIVPLNALDSAEADEGMQREVNQEALCDDDDDKSPSDELSIELITDDECSVDEVDAEFNEELHHKDAEISHVLAPVDGNREGSDTESNRREEFCRVEVLCQILALSENHQDASFRCNNSVYTPDTLLKLDHDDSSIHKPHGPEEHQNLLKETISKEENRREVEDTKSLSLLQHFDPYDEIEEPDQGITEDDHAQRQQDTIYIWSDAMECAKIASHIQQSCSSDDQSDESDVDELYDSDKEKHGEVSLVGSTVGSKARMRIRRKKIPEDPDEIREFNPRAPRFLDLEPDPEAEKVDLRHQMMDERKNSEEYLIDYALRRAVTKLAPARKRKVALLVEAFETVMPLPVYQKALQNATSGFIHARIMQACI